MSDWHSGVSYYSQGRNHKPVRVATLCFGAFLCVRPLAAAEEPENADHNAQVPTANVTASATDPETPPPTEQSTISTETAAVPKIPTREGDEPTRAKVREAYRSPAEGFDEGGHVRYQLERIELSGNAHTHARVILRYLPFRTGREVDVEDPEFTLARYRLLGTGFFRDVQFALRKGSRRGKVVLVVEVVERNTVVVNGVWLGLSADANSDGVKRPLTAYGGVDIAETNLAGTGISLGGAVGVAQDQYALRLRFLEPGFRGSPWMVAGTLLHNHAVDFFGFGNIHFSPHQSTSLLKASAAVLPYTRSGGSIGLGRDLSLSTQLWLHYRLESLSADVPTFAEQDGRGVVEPILFDIKKGQSVFSALQANFQFDTRDHPFLPTRGWLVNTWGELGLAPLGGDYDYQRFDLSASKWWQLGRRQHVLRLQAFTGVISGTIPFFEQYYVGDFCDFLPPRMLGLNVDSRPPSDFLGTSIRAVRYGHYAAKLSAEYRIPLYRGHRSVFGIDFFLTAGLWGLAHHRDLFDPAPKYQGLSRTPIDLTANFGFRMDTSAGGLSFSFSNVLGFFPVRGGGT